MIISDELLMAYADGELDAATRAQVESAIATDPNIAQRVRAHRALRGRLRSSFDPVLDEVIPARLVAAARAAPTEERSVRIVPFRSARPRARAWSQWAALAASFVLGAVAWHFSSQFYARGAITERAGQLVASGALDRALSTRLTAEQTSQNPIQIGVSFRSKDGDYCRTFQITSSDAVAGLACRESQGWRVQMLVRIEARASLGSDAYRPAASGVPSALARVVGDSIEGEPLDARGEATARANQWRPQPPGHR